MLGRFTKDETPHRTERLWLERARTIRDQPGGKETLLLGLQCIVIVLVIWHVLTMGAVPEERIVSPAVLPSLGETLRSFPSLWYDRALARGTMWSLSRVLGGFLLAAAIAVPLGVIAGCYLRVNAFLRPLSVLGRNVPIAALIPMTVIWFGLGELQKIMFIFLATVAFILFDTTHAVESVSSRFIDTAQTLGAKLNRRNGVRRALVAALLYGVVLATVGSMMTKTSWFDPRLWFISGGGAILGFLLWYPIASHQVVQKVLFPLALPSIVNSLRLLFGIAFGYVMLAEVIAADYGLGHIILTSQRRAINEHVYLILIIIALLAFAIDRGIYLCQRRWFPYREFP
jgi:ABC-type nitrate/sulfonate/bicarbonate transport system permease component